MQSNREALWPSNYVNTTQTWQIAQLNQLRKHLEDKKITHNGLTFNQASASIVAADSKTVAIRKGPVLSMLTTVCPELSSSRVFFPLKAC
jgi:hypothetical protein